MLKREFPILKLFCFLSRTTCTAEGKWSHPLPSCLAPCILPEVEQGVLGDLRVGDRLQHGTSITINCTADYEPLREAIAVEKTFKINGNFERK